MKTRGKKNCSEIAQIALMSHDRIQRDLDAATECSEEIRSALISDILRYARKNPGFLIGDGTLLVKEFAKKLRVYRDNILVHQKSKVLVLWELYGPIWKEHLQSIVLRGSVAINRELKLQHNDLFN